MPFDFVLSYDLLDESKKRGLTLSAFLEELDPTFRYAEHERGLDAFQRQLARYDIRTASDPVSGLMCHTWGRFYESDEQGSAEERSVLPAEWVRRNYMAATRVQPRNGMVDGNWSNQGAQGGTLVPSGVRFPVDTPISYALYPPAVFDQLRFQMIQPSMLNLLVSRVRTINSETFDALYLTDSTANPAARMGRVEEYGEIARQRFTTSEQSIRTKKYGGGLDVSYEAMRRMQLDLVSWWIQYVAAKADRDKEDTAIDVLVNGDGNAGTAATNSNGTTLDSLSANKLTLKMWLLWRLLWVRPYVTQVVIGPKEALVDLFLLQAGSANVGVMNVLGQNIPAALNVQMARTTLDNMLAIDNSTVAANTLLALDRNWTLEMVLEAGSQIVDTDRIVQNQYSSIFITENVGFCIATKGLSRTLAYTL
jgi:hypothetical protein